MREEKYVTIDGFICNTKAITVSVKYISDIL